ncbi:sigma-54 interaction domain-containing protein [Tepidibacter hydrothermalis]|uniref:Sigma 54-interacting transcriptional regulator n=1 Tax=Tepidibacter hydrothermalis TaxID=3036126 RepID=A0ABY8EF46_9FIRM|nr:sigma 54-interacting transcriptional regulator [Tepidibacter hydrothermalis]WFD11552.1 sigma 54-interacting transcriptional regulator [Tepidibacter hydrothermalis]
MSKDTFEKEYKKKLDRKTLKKILDNSYDEIFVTDGDGNAIYVNEACERNYTLKPYEVIGKNPWQLTEEGFCFPPITPIVLRDKKQVTLEQKTNIGTRLVVTATPVFDNEGNLEMIVQNSRDMTQIEEIKKDLDQTKQLLLRYKEEVKELRKKEIMVTDLVANSKEMRNLIELAYRGALVDSNILILGESGTGKSVMARNIHKMSNRKEGSFITINCAAIPEQLIESELFGYVSGAFTGADKKGKIGLIELADDGTLFLDEIAEIPLRLQAKLLEVIQERRFIPVGGREVKKIDCRIIAATNRDLGKMVKRGKFREDLYYRLNVIELNMIPLRERIEDIVPLIHFFLKRFNKKYKVSRMFSPECIDMLIQYSWPGNIRELEHTIERLVITVQDSLIDTHHLPEIFNKKSCDKDNVSFSDLIPLDFAVEQIEKELVLKSYNQLGSSYKVAKVLDISQSKASRLIRKYIKKSD